MFVQRDQDHFRVREFLRAKNLWLITNTAILGELFTHLRYNHGFNMAIDVHERLLANPSVRIIHWGQEMDALTYVALRRFPGLSLSYEDASLIALAETQDVSEVFTLDSDFRLAGFTVLPD